MAGMAEDQAAVVKGPDALDAIQHVFIRVNFHGERLLVRLAVTLLSRNHISDVPFFAHGRLS